ncbi:hypothetical protein pZL12.25c [Streptomyces phage ZL12]|uniref:Uncharacterized protein n=1 Tax=Streptomyces phage ZL12 TaxID=2570911 RepID=D0UWD0_9CAUD|nr:hypothetical protein QEH43_gp025 [Streptomyces phage ZL12]ACX71102.1 hypothetical protein pZL12.25c [Streptomyces phage ZL12]
MNPSPSPGPSPQPSPRPMPCQRPGEEAKTMTATQQYAAVAAVLVAVAGAGRVWWQLHRLRRVLRAERAAALLTDATHHRDLEAFRARVARAVAEQQAAEDFAARATADLAVIAAADAIVNAELTRTTHHNPQQEGENP